MDGPALPGLKADSLWSDLESLPPGWLGKGIQGQTTRITANGGDPSPELIIILRPPGPARAQALRPKVYNYYSQGLGAAWPAWPALDYY